jgi:hypothetical protein
MTLVSDGRRSAHRVGAGAELSDETARPVANPRRRLGEAVENRLLRRHYRTGLIDGYLTGTGHLTSTGRTVTTTGLQRWTSAPSDPSY